jgi:hypothetical protein
VCTMQISDLEAVRKSWSIGDMELGHVDDVRIWDYPGRPSEPELVDVKEVRAARHAGHPVDLLYSLTVSATLLSSHVPSYG